MKQQFFEAIRAGDRAQVETLLSGDPALLASKDAQGLGPYTVAKYSGRSDIAALLLEKGVELDLFAASMAGAKERALELIGAHPEQVNAYSHDGWTPLHLACFFRHPDLVEALLANEADVHARSRNPMQNTPLHAAAAGRNTEAVRLLLERGADVNARQAGGFTALHSASQNGDAEVVRLLIAGGANVQLRAENQQSAMDLALTKGQQNVVELLDEYATSGDGASLR